MFRVMRADGASASLTRRVWLACTMVLAMSLGVMCSSLEAVEPPALSATEPMTFQGEIAAGLRIEMKLFRDGSILHGTYLYELYGRDIQVKGTITEAGEIVLQEFVKGKVTGTFKGTFVSKERIDGKWYRPGSDKGRAFFLVTEAAGVSPAPKSAALPAPTPARQSREPVQTVAQVRPAVRLDEALRPARGEVPVLTQQQAQQDKTLSASAPAGPVTVSQAPAKAVELPQVAPKEELAAQSAAVVQEPPKPVAPERQIEPADKKARIEGRAIGPTEKKGSPPWKDLLTNIRVVAGFAGILLLVIGLIWVAIVAGGAAGLRDTSALFHKAHAMGLSFLPGVFLLALGVGAILSAFVE